jgi:AcrR family transcriptional regulator
MRKPDLRGARAEQRRRSNRETILRAAEAVILRRGVGAVSMDDVAAEAQFSKATLYRYFRSKAELVFEIVYHFLEELGAGARAARARSSSAAERLRDAVAVFLRFETEKENIARILLQERNIVQLMQAFVGDQGRTGPDTVRKFILRIRAKRRELVEDTVDPEKTARLFGALVQGYFVELFWTGDKLDIEAESCLICDFILRGIERPRLSA